MAEASKSLGSVRFGPFELALETLELCKHGTPVSLYGQAIQILVALTANPGKLITREELQQKLWPGAGYGDPEHGLNAAINKLREKLGDSATTPTYIETLPGRGYRFIAEVQTPDELLSPDEGSEIHVVEPVEQAAVIPRLPWWKRKATVAVAACTVVAGSLYPWIAPRIDRLRRQSELQKLAVVPLTSLGGTVGTPTFSPDGSQIAFLWHEDTYAKGFDLYVKVIGEDKPRRLTHGPAGTAPVTATWSPDGRNIAVCRFAGSAESELYLISPVAGTERKITSMRCTSLFYGSGLSWAPDGKQLAFLHPTPDSDSALYVLTLDSGEAVPVKTDCGVVMLPAFSPRGDYLAWACADDLSNVPIYLKRLSDGKISQLVHSVQGVGGLAWSGDGRRIVYSTGFTGGDLWEVASARPDSPEKLPFGHDATDLAVNSRSHRLAFKQTHENTNIWRADLFNPQARAEKVVTSSRKQGAPSYSPDGTQIAFESNRSGSYEVWVSNSDGSNAIQLSSFGVMQTGSPSWSPDGKWIAFDSRVGGEANIYIVDPRGGIPRKLDMDMSGNREPTWSHDGKWIYFLHDVVTDPTTVWKVPSNGGHAVQLSKHIGWWALESPDGHLVYFWHEGRLWQVNTDGSGEQPVEGMPLLVFNDAWYPYGSGIYFLASDNLKSVDGAAHFDFFDLNTKAVRKVFVPDKSSNVWRNGISVSPDGRWLLFTSLDEGSSDLMMVENWK
jgi:Tol biopolymer transport system component/DNA-binding winged helix-turn-helix (wHTH) protein